MAAVSAYLKVVNDDKILEHVRGLEKLFTRRLLAIAQKHPSVRRVAGQGLHWTVELHGPDWRSWHADTTEVPIASRVAERALEAGGGVGASGGADFLVLAPAPGDS